MARDRGPDGRILPAVTCGRKHCARCTRWRPVSDFRVRRGPKDRLYLSSDCHACHRADAAEWARQLTESRKSARRAYERAYFAIRRRRAGVPPRAWRDRIPPARLHAGLAREWFLRFERWQPSERGDPTRLINGFELSDTAERALSRMLVQRSVNIGTVDRLCTELDLPLWEVEEYADIRGAAARG